MVTMLLRLICIVFVLLVEGVWAGEEIVYAVNYRGSGKIVAKTELFTIDPETGAKRLLFSDEKAPIVLRRHPNMSYFPVIGGGRLFAHAAQRHKRIPHAGNASIYELSVDGSNSFRKIVPVLGELSLREIFVNSLGTHIGYINRMNKKQYLFVCDIVTGKLLHQVDITDIFLDCYASGIGWVPHSDKFYFSLETGDDHVTSEVSYDQVGTYVIDESGESLTKLGTIPALKGYYPPRSARVIGILPTGEFVFETRQQKELTSHEKPKTLVAVITMKTEPIGVEDISFSPAIELYSGIRVRYQLSPSGKYLAAAKLPFEFSAKSWEIYLKDLQTDKESKIVSIPIKGLKGPFPGIVGWLD